MQKENGVKQQIFNAAAQLFAEGSYSRVSMRDIANKVGIKAASIYYHYASKENILNDILSHYVTCMDRYFDETRRRFAQKGYLPKLWDVLYTYGPDSQLMYWITRIMYMEQFTSALAAETLFGPSHERYAQGYSMFFNALFDWGIIKTKENCDKYTELFVRLGHSFQLDYAHPEFQAFAMTMGELYQFHLGMILKYEGSEEWYDRLVAYEDAD